MTKEVMITMKTCQQVDAVRDDSEITTTATYEYTPVRQVLTYTENTPEEGDQAFQADGIDLPYQKCATQKRQSSGCVSC